MSQSRKYINPKKKINWSSKKKCKPWREEHPFSSFWNLGQSVGQGNQPSQPFQPPQLSCQTWKCSHPGNSGPVKVPDEYKSHPSWHYMEQRQTVPAEPCPSCIIMGYYLSQGVSSIAIVNWKTLFHRLAKSLTSASFWVSGRNSPWWDTRDLSSPLGSVVESLLPGTGLASRSLNFGAFPL